MTTIPRYRIRKTAEGRWTLYRRQYSMSGGFWWAKVETYSSWAKAMTMIGIPTGPYAI